MKACLILVTSIALISSSHAADAFKWTDAQGVVHFGDSVPREFERTAVRIDLGSGETEAQRRDAKSRLAKDRASLDAGGRAGPEAAASGAATPAPAASTANSPCVDAWKRYNDSYACFDPYRFGGGKIRPEAYQVCKEVVQPPALCH